MFDGEINVRDDGGLGYFGGGVGVFRELFFDHLSELASSGSLLGDASFSDNYRAGGGNDWCCGGRRCSYRR